MRSQPAFIQHIASKGWRYFLTFDKFIWLFLWLCSCYFVCFIVRLLYNFLLGLVFGGSGQQVPQQWGHLQNQMRRSSLRLQQSGWDKQLPDIYVITVGKYLFTLLLSTGKYFVYLNVFFSLLYICQFSILSCSQCFCHGFSLLISLFIFFSHFCYFPEAASL